MQYVASLFFVDLVNSKKCIIFAKEKKFVPKNVVLYKKFVPKNVVLYKKFVPKNVDNLCRYEKRNI